MVIFDNIVFFHVLTEIRRVTLLNIPGFNRSTEPSKRAQEQVDILTSIGMSKNTHDSIIITVTLEKEKRRKLCRVSWVSTFEWAYFDVDQAWIFCRIRKNDNNSN